jgi:hypothetical protein
MQQKQRRYAPTTWPEWRGITGRIPWNTHSGGSGTANVLPALSGGQKGNGLQEAAMGKDPWLFP